MYAISSNAIEKKTKTVEAVFAFFASLIIILNSGYYRTTVTDSYVPLLLLIFIVVVGVFCYSPKLAKTKPSGIAFILLAAIIFSIFANWNMPNLLSGGRVAVTMLCAYLLTEMLSLEIFSKYFTVQIKAIIVFAALLEGLLLLGISSFPMLEGYYDLWLITHRLGNRACGLFWEPGVFASMIIISMFFEYYLSNRKVSVLGLALYLVGMALTQSTAGFLLLFIVLIGLLWKKMGKVNKNPLLTVLFIGLVVLLAVFYQNIVDFLVELNPQIFGKLIESNSGTTSTRINAPLINLRVFGERPWLGWGFTDSSAEILSRMPRTGDAKVVAQTSTSTQLLAAIGILGVLYSIAFLMPLFSKKRLSHLRIELKVIIAVCMLLIINKEPHVFIVGTWLLMFYANQKNFLLTENDEHQKNK